MEPNHTVRGISVVGSGPNGLSAAVVLARAGYPAGFPVTVYEMHDTIGGGARTGELTLPGYLHDICSAVHPTAAASPFFNHLNLSRHGVKWIHSPAMLAHPLDQGEAVLIYRSVDRTALQFGRDARKYNRLIGSLVSDAPRLVWDILSGLHFPRYPDAYLHFTGYALRSARGIIQGVYSDPRTQAVFAGMAAHAMQPLDRPITAGFGLFLNLLAHAVGWPLVRGGSQKIAYALADLLFASGGVVVTSNEIKSLEDLGDSRVVVFDLAPASVLRIAGAALPAGYQQQLRRFRYGVGVCKVDFAMDGPIPWTSKQVANAAAVHLGGTWEEIAISEQLVWEGKHPEWPFVILAQPSLFDETRAPPGKHTVWAYCHVPSGSDYDMSERIQAQIERFAPGFRSRILARSSMTAQQMERYNPNYVGGDINQGIQDWLQLFTRPAVRLVPYTTPNPRIFLCSSATPPGGGVHGMCGYHAARVMIRQIQAS